MADQNLRHRVLDTTIAMVLKDIRSPKRKALLKLAREKFVSAGWELAEPSGEDALPDDTMSKEAVKKIVHRRFRILAGSAESKNDDDSVLVVSSAFQLYIFMAWCRPAYCAKNIPPELQERAAAPDSTWLENLPESLDLARAEHDKKKAGGRLFQLRLRFQAFWNLQQLLPKGALNQLVSMFLMKPPRPEQGRLMSMKPFYPSWEDTNFQDIILNFIKDCIKLAEKKAKVFNDSPRSPRSPRKNKQKLKRPKSFFASPPTRTPSFNGSSTYKRTKSVGHRDFPRYSEVARENEYVFQKDRSPTPEKTEKSPAQTNKKSELASAAEVASGAKKRDLSARHTVSVTRTPSAAAAPSPKAALPAAPKETLVNPAIAVDEDSSAESEEDQEIIFLESSRLDFDNWKIRNL